MNGEYKDMSFTTGGAFIVFQKINNFKNDNYKKLKANKCIDN